MRRLRAGPSEGVDLIEVDSGAIRFTIIPTRGMGIWNAQLGEYCLGWNSPVRLPMHPKFVNIAEPGGLGFLAGANEFLFRCGLENAGAPDVDSTGQTVYPLHGRIANLPAWFAEVDVDTDSGQIVVRGCVDEVRFLQQKLRLHVEYRVPFQGVGIEWTDRVENLGATSARMQMLYHINVGEPLLQPGWRLVAPVERICPRDENAAAFGVDMSTVYPAPDAESWEQCYYQQWYVSGSGGTQALLQNPTGDVAVQLRFNGRDLPCLTQWRNTQALADGYVTGLEPATNFPNPRSFEVRHDRIVTLPPAESWETTLGVSVLTSTAEVEDATREIANIRDGRKTSWEPQPVSEWSPQA